MEKRQAITTTSSPLGMCEKIFNALQPTLRPLRRLTFGQHEPPTTTPAISSSPPFAPPKAQTSKPEPQKAQDQKILSTPPPPPPPEAVIQNPKKSTTEKPTKVNVKADGVINRTKGKIRTASAVGRVSSSK